MNLLEVFQRGLKRFGLSDIAGQYLAAAGKALLIQNQCQGTRGQSWAVVSLAEKKRISDTSPPVPPSWSWVTVGR